MLTEPWERWPDRFRWRWLDRLRGGNPAGSIVCRNPRLHLVRVRESCLDELAALPLDSARRSVLAEAADLALEHLRSGDLWQLLDGRQERRPT